MWSIKLPSTAIAVFDVVQGEDLSGPLYVVKQRESPNSQNDNLDPFLSTYIGFREGTYFAMSGDNYPMILLGNWAKVSPPPVADYPISSVAGTDDDSEESCYSKPASYPDCLIGKHTIKSQQRLLSSSNENKDDTVPKEDTPSSGSHDEIQYSNFYVGLSWLTIITLGVWTWVQYGGQKFRKKHKFPKSTEIKKSTPNKKKRKTSTSKKVSFEVTENEASGLSKLTENASPTTAVTAVRTTIINDSSNGKVSPRGTETILEVKLSKLVVSDIGIGMSVKFEHVIFTYFVRNGV